MDDVDYDGRDSDGALALTSLLTASFVAALLAVTRALFGENLTLGALLYLLTTACLVLAYDGGERTPARATLQLLGALAVVILICLLPVGPAARVLLLLVETAVVLFMTSRKDVGPQSLGVAIAAGLSLAVTLFFIVNGKYYANVFSSDSLLFGIAHTDTLYHSAIAGMFANFGVPSTGLDGIPLIRYHTLSNMLLGLLAKGAEIPVPTGYFLGMQIVFLPLLYFALGLATASARATPDKAGGGELNFLVPAMLVGAFGLVEPSTYLVSESHALGLALLLLGSTVIRRVSKRQPLSWATLAAACAVALLATAAKVSVGAVFVCGMGVAFLLARSLRPAQWAAFALFLVVLAVLLFTLFLPTSHSAQSRVVPFSFLVQNPVTALINLATIALGILIGIAKLRSRQEAIWPKVLLVMLLASTAPAMLLQVDGGSAYYFLNIATWLAMVEIAALMADRFGNRRLLVSGIAVATLLISGVATSLAQQVPARFRDYVETFYARSPKPDNRPTPLPLWEQLQAYNQYRPNLPMSILAATIRETKVDARSLVLLTDDVWRELPFSCTDAPFAIPAYVGLPLLMGLRTVSRDCRFGPHYSFPDYEQSPPAAESLTDEEICLAARRRGFEHVLRARSLSEVDDIACAQR